MIVIVEKRLKLFGSVDVDEEVVQSSKEGSVDDFDFVLGQP